MRKRLPPIPARETRQVLAPDTVAFIDQYLVDLDVEAAERRCGMSAGTGSRLLGDKRVQGAIAMARQHRLRRTGINADQMLRRWVSALRADPNEIVQVRVGACRFCWGIDHRYQFTAEELKRAMADHRRAQMKLPEKERKSFDDQGGDGYEANVLPYSRENGQDHDCPECHGDGRVRVVYKDSRYLSEGARLLYQGAEVTDRGALKVKTRPISEVEELVARHIGMFPTSRVPVRTFNPEEMTDEELEAALASYEGGITIEHEEASNEQENLTDVEVTGK